MAQFVGGDNQVAGFAHHAYRIRPVCPAEHVAVSTRREISIGKTHVTIGRLVLESMSYDLLQQPAVVQGNIIQCFLNKNKLDIRVCFNPRFGDK